MKDLSFEIRIPVIRLPREWRQKLKISLSFLIIAGAFMAEQYFDFTFFGTLILAYFGMAVLWNLSSRIAASFALFFLAGTPLLLVLKNDPLAETFAVYAYYFLVITVVCEMIALKRAKKPYSESVD